jgi:sugar transferase (PEP-CTERM system associated)
LTRVDLKLIVLAGVELLLGVLAVYVAGAVRFGGMQLPADAGSPWLVLVRACVFAAASVLALTAMGLYQSRQRLSVEGVIVRVIAALGLAAVGLAVLYFFIPAVEIGRGWWAISLAVSLLFLGGTRVAFSRVVDHDLLRRRIVVYGAGKRAGSLLQMRRRSDQRGFKIVAFLPAAGEAHLIDDERVDCTPGTVAEHALKHEADEIVIAMDERRRGFPIRDLLDCKFRGVDVVDVLSFIERESGKVKIDLMNPSWLIFSEGFTQRGSRQLTARLFDLAVSIMILLIAWPIMLLTALAILIDDGRPILYRQTRVGMLGKPFELLKFRSMGKDAEAGGGARWAQRNDSRVTRVGGFLRKMRIDELPQLLNVIRGDMRFIGPRPERPQFVTELSEKIPYYHERHFVKPGLTGWAQLSYPYGSSEKDALEKLQFDLYYVKNQSLFFDLMILLQTVEVVLWGKGAR